MNDQKENNLQGIGASIRDRSLSQSVTMSQPTVPTGVINTGPLSELDAPDPSGVRIQYGQPLPPEFTPSQTRPDRSVFGFNRRAFMVTAGIAVIVVLAVIGGLGFLLTGGSHPKNNASSGQIENSAQYAPNSLKTVGGVTQLAVSPTDTLAVNGPLKVNKTLTLSPTAAPQAPTAGEIYYDATTKAPYFYNGVSFINLDPNSLQHITNLGGAIGSIALGTGLTVAGNQLAIAPSLLQQVNNIGIATPKVSSLQGQTGAVQLFAGNGISIDGTTISSDAITALSAGKGITVSGNTITNNGVVALESINNSIAVTPEGSGLFDLEALGGGSSGVSSLNTLTGALAITDPQSELGIGTSGSNITISLPQRLAAADSPSFTSLSLSTALSPADGGTGQSSYSTGDLLYASSGSTLGKLSDVAAGSCLTSGGVSTAPVWSSCYPNSTITGTGTAGTLSLWTSNGVIGNSALTESGGNITASNNLIVQGTGGLTLGSGAATTTLLNSATSAITLTLPSTVGTTGQCVVATDNAGGLGFGACLTGASGGSGGVKSVNGISGDVVLQDASGELTFNTSGQNLAISLAATTVSPSSYGNAAEVATFTVNAEGQLTAAGSTPIAISGNQITSGSVAVAQGGTGITSYTTGSLLYASGTSTLAQLNDVAAGQCLTSGGTANAPLWGACGGGNGITGNGTSGQIAFFNGTNTVTGSSILTQASNTVTDSGTLLVQPSTDSTAALQVKDSTGDSILTADTTNQTVTINRASSGLGGTTPNTWQTNSSSLPSGQLHVGTFSYAGYLYEVVGSSIYAARVGGMGATGPWSAVSTLPASDTFSSATVYNGYVYVMESDTIDSTSGCGGGIATIYMATISGSGAIGTWSSTTAASNTGYYGTLVAYNGYLYITGTYQTLNSCANSFSISSNDVFYASVSGTSIGSWSSVTWPADTGGAYTAINNGYLYTFGGWGGNTANTYISTTYVAAINGSNGSVGASTTTTSLPATTWGSTNEVPISGGDLYIVGGGNGSGPSSAVYYATIGTGTISSWTTGPSLPVTLIQNSAALSGNYLYSIGGWNGSASVTSVYYSLLGTASGNNNILQVAYAGTNTLSVSSTGSVLQQPNTDSTTAFQVQNAAGTSVAFDVDTVDNWVGIGTTIPTNRLSVGALTTANPGAQIAVSTGGTTNSGIVVQDVASQSAGYGFQLQSSSGTSLASIDYAGNLKVNSATLTTALSVANGGTGLSSLTTGSLLYASSSTAVAQLNDAASGQCLMSAGTSVAPAWGNCASATSITGSGTSGKIALFNGSQTITSSVLSQSASAVSDTGTFTVAPGTTSTAAFSVQNANNSSVLNVDTTNQLVELGPGATNGSPWLTNPHGLPTAESSNASAEYGGYMYEANGGDGKAYYAKINSDGTTGTWSTATNLPVTGNTNTYLVAYNGYLYATYGSASNIMGQGSAAVTTYLYYAPINADGSIGTWTSTSAPGLINGYFGVSGGYLYFAGGEVGSSYDNNPGGRGYLDPVSNVNYAPINAGGSVGTWASGTGLPGAAAFSEGVIYNGYIYVFGGESTYQYISGGWEQLGYSYSSTIYYATLSGTSIGPWQTNAASLPQPVITGTAEVYSNSVYIVGGSNGGSELNTVYQGALNLSGPVGTMSSTPYSLPTASGSQGGAIYNGFLYNIGGWNGSAATQYVYYTSLGSMGVHFLEEGQKSTTAFQVQDANNSDTLDIDTTNDRIGVNTSSPGNTLSIGALTTAAGTYQIAVTTGGTTNSGIVVQDVASQSSGYAFTLQDSTGANLASIDYQGNLSVKNATITGLLTVNGHIVTANASGSTTATVQTAAGTGASCSVVGDDTDGTITLTTGSTAWAAGAQCQITFDTAFPSAPNTVITPTDTTNIGSVQPTVTDLPGSFTVNFINADTAANTYTWHYVNLD